WHDGALLREWQDFDERAAADKKVAILLGTRPRAPGRPAPDAGLTRPDGTPLDMRTALEEIASGLQSAGVDATFEPFAQADHGDMLRISLERALQITVEP